MGKHSILIKYGGNAMLNNSLKKSIAEKIKTLTEKGYQVFLVHGGGPFINKGLEDAGIRSEFIEGHRYTSEDALKVVEKTLKGEVNSDLVSYFNQAGLKAVGLSGKDGDATRAEKRYHSTTDGSKADLGRVGNISSIDTTLYELLSNKGFTPIIACIANDKQHQGLNVNADMFAGNLAAALQVDYYIVLTDIDGLLMDINKAESIISQIKLDELDALKGSVIQGGMIPKIESCEIAVHAGAKKAVILNGTKAEQITDYILDKKVIGTTISK